MHRPKRLWDFTNWLVPLLYALGGVIVGLIIPRIESRLWPDLLSPMSVSSAIAIYSAIASGMIALTGIVFSLVFVMVQFSATAYSPRLVLWIARDPVMSHALGVFVATFLYVVAASSGVDRFGSGKVPLVSVVIVFVLLLASVGMFVAIIHRVSRLQVNRMLVFTGNQGRLVIGDLYPEPASFVSERAGSDFRVGAASQTLVHHDRPHCIQSMDIDGLLHLAEQSGGVIEMLVSVGDTIVESTVLAQVWGARAPIDKQKLNNLIRVGDGRTFEQDPKYALRLLVDIAIRALSPAVNDPTTAVQALDQIQDLLVRIGNRHLDIQEICGHDGELRLVVPFPVWEDFLLLAFDEIRYYGATSVQVMRRMTALVSDLIAALPPKRHVALHDWQRRIESTVARSFADEREKMEAVIADSQGLGVPRRRTAGQGR
jgi:uncharacterized membrane protein